jgi:histidyl-tRNA synthetase
LNGILEYAGVSEDKRLAAIISIDKLSKIGEQGVSDELEQLGISKNSCAKIISIFKKVNSKNPLKTLEKISSIVDNENAKQGILELKEVFSLLSKKELKDVLLNISLARGLSYYTGTVFEGFARNSEVKSSICGGGRYDEMIKLLLEGKEDTPAVGISFGLVPIMEVLKLKNPALLKSVVSVYVIPIGNVAKEALEIVSALRKKGIKTDLDLMKRGISKNLDFANSFGIPLVLFIGENELKDGKLKVRNMTSGEESFVSLKNASSEIKKIVSKLK